MRKVMRRSEDTSGEITCGVCGPAWGLAGWVEAGGLGDASGCDCPCVRAEDTTKHAAAKMFIVGLKNFTCFPLSHVTYLDHGFMRSSAEHLIATPFS